MASPHEPKKVSVVALIQKHNGRGQCGFEECNNRSHSCDSFPSALLPCQEMPRLVLKTLGKHGANPLACMGVGGYIVDSRKNKTEPKFHKKVI